MNIPTKTISLFASAALLSLSSLSAQVQTDPVGYVSQSFASGTHFVSSPLFTSLAAQGAAGAISGDDVVVSGLPTLESPHFLLVTSGTATGSFRSILSASGTTATLESAIPGLAQGDAVRVIEHFTIGDLHAASGNTIPDNTTCTVYSADGSKDTYLAAANNWYDSGFNVSDNVIIFPGEGMVIGFAGATTMTFTGLVNVNEITVPLTSGAVNLVGSVSPTAPVGVGSIGDALSSLPDNSTITLYSDDGNLTKLGTYLLAGGDWYDSGFNIVDITKAAPGAIVVGPSASQNATLPAAYTNSN